MGNNTSSHQTLDPPPLPMQEGIAVSMEEQQAHDDEMLSIEQDDLQTRRMCDGHEVGCGGIRGHSTPPDSPSPEYHASDHDSSPIPGGNTRSPDYNSPRAMWSPSASHVRGEWAPSPTHSSPLPGGDSRLVVEPTRTAEEVATTSQQDDQTMPATQSSAMLDGETLHPSLAMFSREVSQPVAADRRAQFANFPDPQKDKSKQLRYYQKVHAAALAVQPREKLSKPRYWIAIIPVGKHYQTASAKKQLFWFKGNRWTTVETVRRKYSIATATADICFLLGHARVRDSESLQDLDLCNSKLIVLKCVEMQDAKRLARKISAGLVPPPAQGSLITDTRPMEIVDDEHDDDVPLLSRSLLDS